jgi:protein-S-isoprenylcysteine O-methyltransferase Ste14
MDPQQICKYLWSGFFLAWFIWAIRTKPIQKREPVSTQLLYIVVTTAAFYLVFAARIRGEWLHIVLFPAREWVAIAGVVVTAAGLGFAIWARVYLGGNWSGAVSVKVGHELIRSGPYRWVRHPIYTGIILALLGTALEIDQARGLVAVILLYLGFKIKSRIEERVMRQAFGAEYDEYSRSTGAIVPRLHF